jgi:hypothetical protein
LKPSMYDGGTHFAKLKGKAAEIRHLGGPLVVAFQRHMDQASVTHRQVLLGLRYSVAMEELVDSHAEAIVWPAAAAEQFLEAAYNYLACQTALGQHFQRPPEARLLFLTTIKSHVLLHLAMLTKHMSPRLAWCYAGEDLMHRVRGMVAGAQRGTNPVLVVSKVMRKYLWALSFDAVSAGGWWR